MKLRTFFALTFVVAAVACHPEVSQGSGGGGAGSQGTGGGPGQGGGAPCSANADCSDGELCVYDIQEACAAHGTCLPRPTPEPCGALIAEKACGCDGQEVDWLGGCQSQVPNGYAPAPIAHVGACGTMAQCNVSSDCTPANGYTPPEGFTHGECAFLQSDGCAARGTCVDPFPQCDDLIVTIGCACDGSEVTMGCGYPVHEYAPVPLAHLGPCHDP